MSNRIDNNAYRAANLHGGSSTSRNVDNIQRDTRKSGGFDSLKSSTQSPFERELQSQVDHGQSQSGKEDIGRIRQQEQQSTSRFHDLISGQNYSTRPQETSANNPAVEIVDQNRVNQNNDNLSQKYGDAATRGTNYNSAFWNRDTIDDAVVLNQGAKTQNSIPQNDLRETYFRPVNQSFDFAGRGVQNERTTQPVTASKEAPETRASLLSIVQAQGPGSYLHLFA